MIEQPPLLKEDLTTPADAKIAQVMERIVQEYEGDLGAYIEAVRRRNPLPTELVCDRGFAFSDVRHCRRRTP